MNSQDRGNIIVIALAATLFFLNLWREDIVEWTALLLIIVAGIPHGSFDLRVAEKKWPFLRSKPVLIISLYSLIGIMMSSLCFLVPSLGLVLFLIISILHFIDGERLSRTSTRGTAEVVGISAVLLPILIHFDEAKAYMAFFIPSETLFFSASMALIIGCLISFLVLFAVITNFIKGNKEDALQLLACLISWICLPPLAGFGVWFLGRHSRFHLRACGALFSQGLKSVNSSRAIPLDFIAISLTAILLILPLSYWFDFTNIHQLFAASIILIAGLTLPHILVTFNIEQTLHS